MKNSRIKINYLDVNINYYHVISFSLSFEITTIKNATTKIILGISEIKGGFQQQIASLDYFAFPKNTRSDGASNDF